MSDLFAAYLSGAAAEFFSGHFADAGARRAAVRRGARPLAPAVAAALAAQNASLPPSPAREANLAALAGGAAAVVTGQQVGLFLGPLYTIYKAATAVRTAAALAEETGLVVVPVFWMQTEDHDLAEIAACHVPCAGGAPLSLCLPASAAERVSIAHRRLPGAVADCLTRLRAEIGGLPHGPAHLERLERHYRPGAGWAAAFAAVLAELFAADGLVVIDPRRPTLAGAAAAIHRRALSDAAALAAALVDRVAAIEAAGFAAPVHVRAGAPLSFFHPDGPGGPRFRLEPAAGGFREVGGERVHSLAALLAALDAEPLRFSTSALLRPILQDSLLPTAVYVGGPAEVAYYAQLAPLYRAYDLAMPLLVPRARVRLLDRKTAQILTRLGVAADDAARPEAELLAAAHASAGDARPREAVSRRLLAPLDAALGDLERDTAHLGVDGAIAKTRAAVAAAVARLASKVERAHHERNGKRVADVRRLKAFLHPNDVPQERFYSLSYFAARYGERPLLERLLERIDPFHPNPIEVELPDAPSIP